MRSRLVAALALVLLGPVPSAGAAPAALPSPTMSIDTAGPVHAYGSRFTLTVRLFGPTVHTGVRVYATPAGQAERLIADADVDPSTHNLKLAVQVRRNTRFRAVFDGDEFWGPASASARVAVPAGLTLTSASRAMTGRFHRLPASSAVVVGLVRAAPAPPAGCVRASRYRWVRDRWRLLDTRTCLVRGGLNQVRVRLPGFAPGTRLKVVARFGSSSVNTASPVRTYYVLLV